MVFDGRNLELLPMGSVRQASTVPEGAVHSTICFSASKLDGLGCNFRRAVSPRSTCIGGKHSLARRIRASFPSPPIF